MIDDPEQFDKLLAKLQAALPFEAAPTPELAAILREQAPGIGIPARCPITSVHDGGDAGGIVCRLELASGEDAKVFFTSITHLRFDPRLPLTRAVVA